MRFGEISWSGETAVVELASVNGGERVDVGFYAPEAANFLLEDLIFGAMV
jgi:hypothetical protein